MMIDLVDLDFERLLSVLLDDGFVSFDFLESQVKVSAFDRSGFEQNFNFENGFFVSPMVDYDPAVVYGWSVFHQDKIYLSSVYSFRTGSLVDRLFYGSAGDCFTSACIFAQLLSVKKTHRA